MTAQKLHLAPDLALPLDAVTETFLIFGKRGSGKSTTSTVMTEEMISAGLPVAVLDPMDVWWGLRSSADGQVPGLPVTILGGPHADLPLTPDSGAAVADLLAAERILSANPGEMSGKPKPLTPPKPWVRPDCRCWCQVRPVVCALACCGCVVHAHGTERIEP